MRYLWSYDVVLLVGLAELKAQIRWIDPSTVRNYGQHWLNRFC